MKHCDVGWRAEEEGCEEDSPGRHPAAEGKGGGQVGPQRERKVICRPQPWRETREAGAGAGEWAKVATVGFQARRASSSVSVSAPIP